MTHDERCHHLSNWPEERLTADALQQHAAHEQPDIRYLVGLHPDTPVETLRQLAVQSMDASIPYETLSNMTQDRAEAVAAFRERRAPKLTGE